MDCGKACLTESRTKARALVYKSFSRAYYCPDCRAWHTTSEPLAGQHIQYRIPRFSAK